MAHDLHVPNLAANADLGHFGLEPTDNIRQAKAQGFNGVAVVFVDQRPRAGTPLLPSTQRHATIDASKTDLIRGVANNIPVRDFSAANRAQFEANNQ